MKRLELNVPTLMFVVATRAALGVGAATTIPAALAVLRGIESREAVLPF